MHPRPLLWSCARGHSYGRRRRGAFPPPLHRCAIHPPFPHITHSLPPAFTSSWLLPSSPRHRDPPLTSVPPWNAALRHCSWKCNGIWGLCPCPHPQTLSLESAPCIFYHPFPSQIPLPRLPACSARDITSSPLRLPPLSLLFESIISGDWDVSRHPGRAMSTLRSGNTDSTTFLEHGPAAAYASSVVTLPCPPSRTPFSLACTPLHPAPAPGPRSRSRAGSARGTRCRPLTPTRSSYVHRTYSILNNGRWIWLVRTCADVNEGNEQSLRRLCASRVEM
ncbi:hypothetical protein C8F04DRAFT_649553 [Mycena alexandri]|uniref:Uncharacterized protein n=1 Tax=Mycena alexandri TaxID=1745969 RepID=A0AAD6SRA4_9AGAR|nr:hypothetical protein C8F04DRAFT_649553 [Mycena alexandri]